MMNKLAMEPKVIQPTENIDTVCKEQNNTIHSK